jgi:hypothetical protein
MTEQYQRRSINDIPGGPSGISSSFNFSVNSAAVDLTGDEDGVLSFVLRTGATINPTGSFTGGGIGNKAIFGIPGYNGNPLSSLQSIEFQWENVFGPAGPNFIPPGAATTVTPYVNIIVDFDPNGAGDIRVLVVASDQLAPAISSSIGTYVNVANTLTYSWNALTDNVLIVLSPPDPVPGGVLPDVTVGPSWPNNSYKMSDLVAANPDAILITACDFPDDGGLPAGASVPSILIVSGDSANVTKNGKRINYVHINNVSLL